MSTTIESVHEVDGNSKTIVTITKEEKKLTRNKGDYYKIRPDSTSLAMNLLSTLHWHKITLWTSKSILTLVRYC